jgi:cytochrome c-type biogenesis protein CcmH/NrfG
MVLEESG